MAQGKALLVSTDRPLITEVIASDRARAYEMTVSASAAEAEVRLASPSDGSQRQVVIIDEGSLSQEDSGRVRRAAAGRAVIFTLRPVDAITPSQAAPLRDLTWPLPAAFVDEAAVVRKPVVFLVDRSIFLARAVDLSFKPTGVQPVVLQSTDGIAEFIKQSSNPIQRGPGKGFYDTLAGALFGKQGPAPVPPGGPLLGNVIVALFQGTRQAAADLDAKVRALVPEAVCYRVTTTDPLVEAGRALETGGPVHLARTHARHIIPLMVCPDINTFAPLKVPVLLMERDPEKLAELGRALLADGYHVELAKSEGEVGQMVTRKGRFQVAIIGVSFAMSYTYGVDTGPALALELHKLDPDLRFIFMVDLYPLERSVREMSRLIELGADDAIVKPVGPTRLVMSVDRAVKRRTITVEHSRLWVPAMVQVAFGQTSPNVNLIGGRYEMVVQLGEGGMGLVFLANDRQLGRKVALKKMRSELKATTAQREKFIEEARLVSRLAHPYIVGVHDIMEHQGEIFLVLDYVDGKPLSEHLQEQKQLGLPQCRKILEQVCQGVDFAHRNNVLHRDLKPSNIMIDGNGYAKVMDFGLARELKDAVSTLSPKDAGGTLAYMAPEQHLGKCSKASDVYSLGVCLYEMLAGVRPFKGPDYLSQKERRLYTPLSGHVAGLSARADDLMALVFDPAPHQRVADALSFYDLVKKL